MNQRFLLTSKHVKSLLHLLSGLEIPQIPAYLPASLLSSVRDLTPVVLQGMVHKAAFPQYATLWETFTLYVEPFTTSVQKPY